MDQRTDAKRSIESSTRNMTEIAQELSRRASPRYIGEQVKEKALNKTHEWKEQVTTSPTALGLLGGALGAAIGGAIARSFRDGRDRRRFESGGYGYRDDLRYAELRYGDTRNGDSRYPDLRYRDDADRAGSVKEKMRDGADKVKDTAQELKDRASNVISDVRERIPSAAEVKETMDDNPMLIALGGLALGAIAALLLPVSRKEREMLEPMKEQAGQALGSLGDKMGESMKQAKEKLVGDQPEQSRQESGSFPPPTPNPLVTH